MSGDRDIVERLEAEVVRCPGRGSDGHGMQHCAECCFGSGVQATTDADLRIMLLARDAKAEIERLRRWKAEATIVLNQWNEIAGDVNRLHAADYLGRSLPDIVATNFAAERALADQLADVLRIIVRDWCPSTVRVPILAAHAAARNGSASATDVGGPS